jgi:phosphatidylglycerophosphatase A
MGLFIVRFKRGLNMKFKDGIRVFFGSGFFLGLGPLLPGSFGALVGLAWHAFAFQRGWQSFDIRIWCLTGAAIFSAVHYILTPWAQKYWNDPDPKNFVLDEIVGYLCVPVFAVDFAYWWQLPASFAVFRILDAIKLPGARYIDRNIHNAHGVLLDDVVSAAYTAAIISLITIIFF